MEKRCAPSISLVLNPKSPFPIQLVLSIRSCWRGGRTGVVVESASTTKSLMFVRADLNTELECAP